ncbi:MAG: T9SS type A sorting domain-containing protein [Candidatus Marinimicrobia bacterium]|nr:T9SS type A sorting domain-containing protein [Candidatus Neomarinimicrobiota bacterium]
MKSLKSIFALLLPLFMLADVSIYDIQFTTSAGDGTYPSPYAGQTVTTGGIVTAINYSNGRYFISSSSGGPWNGIYVYDNNNSPSIGDSVHFQGEVYEYHGFSELKSLSNFTIVSSGNSLPDPAQVTSHDVVTEEAYESALVRVINVGVTEGYDSYDEWRISDGSGPCIISNGIFNLADMGISLATAYPFAFVQGVVSYSWGEFRLHPRSVDDLQSMQGAYMATIGSASAYDFSELSIPVQLALLGSELEVTSFSLDISYNSSVIQYSGYAQTGTVSEVGTIIDNSSSGRIILNYSGQGNLTNLGNLLDIQFTPTAAGNADISFISAEINGQSIIYKTAGTVSVFTSAEPIGDTLTVIQSPILNIPSIVTPEEAFEIVCLAPETTVDWTASLIYGSHVIALNLIGSHYDSALNRWFLQVRTPEPPFYELYDLEVVANGLQDISRNAVQVIPERKSSYNFVHITDTHLPTNIYYYEPQSLEDSSSIMDLRAIIEDINILRPAFVLITGDLVHEGELEDFQNRRYYTKAQRVLGELEVPFYLVAGNHDLGGWDDTPPPQGTARRNWWKFFGWTWLDTPPVSEPQYTQDFSFDYGPVHYIGLEAYDNYDGFRWSIYGGESFTAAQMQWLNQDISAATNSQSKVMFFHYDFSNQLNLSSLGVDMALWGHTHQTSGDIYSHPYNLSTRATSNGARTYRVIRVQDGVVQAEEPVYTNWPAAQSLSSSFSPSNSGESDTVSAIIINNHNLVFEDALLKFNMPIGEHGYSVENGRLDQVVRSEDLDVCYVSFDLLAGSQATITVYADTNLVGIKPEIPQNWALAQNYPNPFNPSTHIQFNLPQANGVKLNIHDLNGKLVRVLVDDYLAGGTHFITWDGLDTQGSPVESGIYFYRLTTELFTKTMKMTLLR